MLAVKLPKDSATDRLGKGPTDFHQDFGSLPLRAESIVIWIALAEITPKPDREQTIAAGNAAMRYADELGIILTRQVSA